MKIALFGFVFYTLILSFSVSAQDLRNLPDTARERILIEKAEATMLKYGDIGYYNARITPPVISTMTVTAEGENKGRFSYIVTFPYDTVKYVLEMNYAAKIYIWADSAKVWHIVFGNGWGYFVEDLELRGVFPGKMPFQYKDRAAHNRELEESRLFREARHQKMLEEYNRRMERERPKRERERRAILEKAMKEYRRQELRQEKAARRDSISR